MTKQLQRDYETCSWLLAWGAWAEHKQKLNAELRKSARRIEPVAIKANMFESSTELQQAA